jgi:predicted ATPase
VKGYAAAETKAAVERARLLIEKAEALGEPPEDPLLLLSVVYGFWAASYVAFNGRAMLDLAGQFLALAEKQGTSGARTVAHRLMGTSLLCTGSPAESRNHYDRALALYDPQEHRPLAIRFGQDPKVSILCFRALALWLLGYADAALQDAEDALRHARSINHAASLMFSLGILCLTRAFCGDHAAAKSQADELAALAEEKGALFWKALGLMDQGWLSGLAGEASGAVHMISSGMAAWRSTGATMFAPFYLSCLASLHAELGHFDDARRSSDEAATTVEATMERWCEAEIHRIAGEIALKSPESDAAMAESCLQRALEVARAQRAKSWELRAAMDTARLWRDRGQRRKARDLLAPIYGWFTEGFDTLDLREAKALLKELA